MLDKLDKAPNYNHAIKKLDAQEQSIMQKLMRLMGNDDKMAVLRPSKKHKCTVFEISSLRSHVKYVKYKVQGGNAYMFEPKQVFLVIQLPCMKPTICSTIIRCYRCY